MPPQFNCVLLVDDDEATNFLHRLALEEHGCAKQVVCTYNGQEALDFLTTPVDGQYPSPEVIFLDINMPGVNGWDFLEAYKELDPDQRGGIVIVMLTTSLNPYDQKKAKTIQEISDFKNKPLTEEALDQLVENYFGRSSN